MQTVEQLADVPIRDDKNNASTKEAIENDVAQMESIGDDIAFSVKRHCSIRRESSECEKETADDSKSEAEFVDVADTLKHAISERMRVIRLPIHRRRHSCSFLRPRVAPNGLRVLWCEGSASMVSVAVCVVLTA